MKEHHIAVTRTARYATIGNETDPKDVWFCLHGYGQLSADFIRYLGALDDGAALVVAPEGLSRFYHGSETGKHSADAVIGASWMTREDRDNEILDYVRYLDRMYENLFERLDRAATRVRVLGFSQGAETAARWVDRGRIEVDHLVLWGGLVPRDVDPQRPGSRFGRCKLTLVFGKNDYMATPERMALVEKRLGSLDYQLETFDGGHHLTKTVLSRLAKVEV